MASKSRVVPTITAPNVIRLREIAARLAAASSQRTGTAFRRDSGQTSKKSIVDELDLLLNTPTDGFLGQEVVELLHTLCWVGKSADGPTLVPLAQSISHLTQNSPVSIKRFQRAIDAAFSL